MKFFWKNGDSMDSLEDKIKILNIIKNLAEEIVQVISHYDESTDVDFAMRITKQNILKILVYLLEENLSQFFDAEMLKFFSAEWRDGNFSQKSAWLQKYFPKRVY